MSEWKEYKLKNITTKIGSGATPRGGSNNYKLQGISLIRSQNVLDLSFSNDGLAFIDNDQAEELNNVTVQKDDILLNITGDSVARVCKVPENVLPARVNQHVLIIRADKNKLNGDFLLYHLNYKKEWLLSLSEIGGTRRALTKGMIEDLELSISDLSEQTAIASILSSLDDKIDLLHRQNKTLEQLAETIFRQWFVEEAEKGWDKTTLGKIGKVITGKTPSTRVPEYWGSDISFITPSDFFKYSKYATAPERFLSRIGAETMKNALIEKKAIIVTCIGSDMGKVAITTEVCVTNQQINSLLLADSFPYYEYVYQYLKSIYLHLKNIALGGTTMPIINKTDFENIEIPKPTAEIILKFEKITQPLNQKFLLNIHQIKTLTQLRDSLLPKLMSGEVRVQADKKGENTGINTGK